MSTTMQWPYAGLGHAPSYQVAGIPYATSSTTTTTVVKEIQFPYVTSWVYLVHHSANDLRVGFSQNGVNGTNFFLMPGVGTNGESVTARLPLKVSSLFFRSDSSNTIPFYVCAGLTSIPTSELNGVGPNGSNWSGSSGVG